MYTNNKNLLKKSDKIFTVKYEVISYVLIVTNAADCSLQYIRLITVGIQDTRQCRN